jgi:hypothetical protein
MLTILVICVILAVIAAVVLVILGPSWFDSKTRTLFVFIFWSSILIGIALAIFLD